MIKLLMIVFANSLPTNIVDEVTSFKDHKVLKLKNSS